MKKIAMYLVVLFMININIPAPAFSTSPDHDETPGSPVPESIHAAPPPAEQTPGHAAIEANKEADNTDPGIMAEKILSRVESRYSGRGFHAGFHQKSVLAGMDITDTADGHAWFMYPGKMRWEYEKPEHYAIISDGKTVWIYKPDDNQVIIGKASDWFGNGQGASFLSDFAIIRDTFEIARIEKQGGHISLTCIPKKVIPGLTSVTIIIDDNSADIIAVETVNTYGDVTRISFGPVKFDDKIDPSLFFFSIPQGTDILVMDAPPS